MDNRKTVLLATQKPFTASAVAGIREMVEKAGYEFHLLEKYQEQIELENAVRYADALIVRSDKVTADVIAAGPKLKIVVRAGAGYDNLDLEACTAAGVVAMNTPGQNANAVAELAIALMIFMNRAQFTPATGSEILGKSIGIQAFGNVGRLVGAKAAALGMKVKALDPFLTPGQIEEAGAQPVETLDELYSTSDFISIHIPATPQTVGSIGYGLISKMPQGAVLVNTARKEVIDEDGLFRALKERQDLKYVTDVSPDNMEMLRAEFGTRVFATPKKMGAQTVEANVNSGLAAARQIVDFFEKGIKKFQVNR